MKQLAPTSLLLGNFVTGIAVLGPVGMLGDIARGLAVSVADAGLLVTFGAAVICIASPVTAWLTTHFDRRRLLAGTLMFVSAAHVASAFAPSYPALLALRLVMLAVAALFTPQAAATAALMAPSARRGGVVSYVFLGWSLSVAIGLPAIAKLSAHLGWRAAYVAIASIALVGGALAAWRLPPGLTGVSTNLGTWRAVAREPLVRTLLLICILQMAGQFVIFPFVGPVMARADTGPDAIALLFLTWGAAAFAGNLVASRVVDAWGGWKTSLWCLVLVASGILGWTLSAGAYAIVVASLAVWGLGFASANSMSQVRLVTAAPALASASVALATSSFYVGQALGSAIGGALFDRQRFRAMSTVALGFVVLAIVLTVHRRK